MLSSFLCFADPGHDSDSSSEHTRMKSSMSVLDFNDWASPKQLALGAALADVSDVTSKPMQRYSLNLDSCQPRDLCK